MLNETYSDKIIKYAVQPPLQSRLYEPDAVIIKRSNFCGSKIEIEIKVENKKIIEYWQKIDACALGTATSTIVAKFIINASFEEVKQAQMETQDMLKNGDSIPSGRFEELKILQSISNFPNRHKSTMLVLDALVAAIDSLTLRLWHKKSQFTYK